MPRQPIDLAQFSWLNKPGTITVTADSVEFSTAPMTDFWQRTHDGMQRSNGHAFLTRLWDDFSFSVQAEFVYEMTFDQCGLLLWIDDENWAKASLEYGPAGGVAGMLGSVVTNNGYSDWASTPLDPISNRLWFRISRRGPDFRFECSGDGGAYSQMRIFHMHGDLTNAQVGVYACSPRDSSFSARFTELAASPSVWVD